MISAWIKATKGFIVWAAVDRAEQGSLYSFIVVKKNKNKRHWRFHSPISGNSELSKFPAQIITQGEAQDELSPLGFSRDIMCGVYGMETISLCVFSHKKKKKIKKRLATFNCSWPNLSTGLKIHHKGQPSTMSSRILCERPPAWRGQVTACYTEEQWKEGNEELRRGQCENEGRKHVADRAYYPRPAHTTTETTYICSHAQEHIHTQRT